MPFPSGGSRVQGNPEACIEARAAIAGLKQAGELIPNQAVLINSIPLQEAQASSEIESIVTTTNRLFRFADERETLANPATKEAFRYRTVLHEGLHRSIVIRLHHAPRSASAALSRASTSTAWREKLFINPRLIQALSAS